MERIVNTLTPLATVLARLYGIEVYTSVDIGDRYEKLIDFVLKAEKSLRVVTGEGRVYQDGRVVDKIQTLVSLDKDSVEVILGPKADLETAPSLRKAGATVYQLPVDPNQHFVIVDDQQLRIESPHTMGQERRTQFFMRDPETIARLDDVFEQLKTKSTKLG